jgi:hypothetical protein
MRTLAHDDLEQIGLSPHGDRNRAELNAVWRTELPRPLLQRQVQLRRRHLEEIAEKRYASRAWQICNGAKGRGRIELKVSHSFLRFACRHTRVTAVKNTLANRVSVFQALT